jgi:hypothetical protein
MEQKSEAVGCRPVLSVETNDSSILAKLVVITAFSVGGPSSQETKLISPPAREIMDFKRSMVLPLRRVS